MSDIDNDYSDQGHYDEDNMEELDDADLDNEDEDISSRSGDSSNDDDDDNQSNESDSHDSDSDGAEYAEEGGMAIIQANGNEESQSKQKVTPPFLTKYERARIIGTRALQIAQNSPIYVETDEKDYDPIQIAEKEFVQNKIPFIVRRFLPNRQYEDWALSELEVLD